MSTSFNTMKVRFNFPHVFHKNTRNRPEDQAKYELTVLIPKEDKETLQRLRDAAREVYEAEKNSTFRGLNFEEVMKPYHDGDGRKPKGGAYGDECKGCYVLNARSNNQPKVFTADKAPCNDETKVYSGCYGRVNVSLYAYNNSGNRGIACGLNGVLTYNFGDAIDGKTVTADTFNDGFDDDGAYAGDDFGL